MAGKEWDPPSAEDLLDAGVQSFDSEDGKGIEDPDGQIDSLLSKLDNDEGGSSSHPPMPLVTVGTGLPALSKKLIARVLANEYIDFGEIPPAKGKGAGPCLNHWKARLSSSRFMPRIYGVSPSAFKTLTWRQYG